MTSASQLNDDYANDDYANDEYVNDEYVNEYVNGYVNQYVNNCISCHSLFLFVSFVHFISSPKSKNNFSRF